MKKFILILFALISFGIANAQRLNVITPGLKPHITIIPINNLEDYNVTFRFIPKPGYARKEMATIQNKIAIVVYETAIEIRAIEKDEKGFAKDLSL
jgi:hypothetical protein